MNTVILLAVAIIIIILVLSVFIYLNSYNIARGQSPTTSNLTELGLENFTTIDDANKIKSIKRLGVQATNEVKTFTDLINTAAGTCAYKMEQDAFNTTLAQMCADFMVDYANTLRNFTQSNQDTTDSILSD